MLLSNSKRRVFFCMDSKTIILTYAAHKHGNLNLRSCGKSFFPADVFGSSSQDMGLGTLITLKVEGFCTLIKTDIPTDRKTGNPRWIFRKRNWVIRFVRYHKLRPMDSVVIKRISERTYEVRPNNMPKVSKKTKSPMRAIDKESISSKKSKRLSNKIIKEDLLFQNDTNIYKESKNNFSNLDARKLNILKSPKKGGSSTYDSLPYLQELNLEIIENTQPIQFTSNINEHIHRWAPYVQGFSAQFVQSLLDEYNKIYFNPTVLDPFAGCGTVLVQAKLNGYKSVGTELNPLLQFIANTKLNCWDVSPSYLLKIYKEMSRDKCLTAPSFLKSGSHFRIPVLKNLETINGGISDIVANTDKKKKVKDLLRLAFSSILIDCSNLKRSPCLGYVKNKLVEDSTPFILFNQKVNAIADDLIRIHWQYKDFINTESQVICSNAMDFRHSNKFDLAITSPPYMNGLDYVMNYKIEMGWLGFVHSQRDLKKIKDDMVVCDNVSKGLIKKFYESNTTYTNEWVEKIKVEIKKNIIRRGAYRRQDMPYIVHKYFDDLHKVMKNVVFALKPGGRFILVIGDSLIADVYVPTDLLIAKIGMDLGLIVEKVEKARDRRSGQIRSYKLRESIVTLLKK
jgi:DNA modification methylase